jgi:hypothetical protein
MKVLIAQGNTKVAEALALNLQNQDCVVELISCTWKHECQNRNYVQES